MGGTCPFDSTSSQCTTVTTPSQYICVFVCVKLYNVLQWAWNIPYYFPDFYWIFHVNLFWAALQLHSCDWNKTWFLCFPSSSNCFSSHAAFPLRNEKCPMLITDSFPDDKLVCWQRGKTLHLIFHPPIKIFFTKTMKFSAPTVQTNTVTAFHLVASQFGEVV